MGISFCGVYAIPPTPFTEADRVDVESLRRAVDFCVACGGHGVVAPVNASEGPFLTDEERRLVTETIVEQTNRRIPVMVGVSGASTRASVEYARHAEAVGADALIAMPPYIRHNPQALRDRSIAAQGTGPCPAGRGSRPAVMMARSAALTRGKSSG